MKYTLHVCALPHTNTTSEYLSCAYTQNVIKFCAMMKSLGHKIFLYGTDKNKAPCDEFIQCLVNPFTPDNFQLADFNLDTPHWKEFNKNMIEAMEERVEQKDFICLIGGRSQQAIAEAFKNNINLEFAVGYPGPFSKYKVFCSYAWMHALYGQGGAGVVDGNFFDAVIPHYLDSSEFSVKKKELHELGLVKTLFPSWSKKEEKIREYYLFIGRLIDRKGFQIAADVCEHLGKDLAVAGFGTPPKYGKYFGVVDLKRKVYLMQNAKAVFVPTKYIEPFGLVMAEANMCGTPVITTDWGAFSENVVDGLNGFRCRTFKEFCEAAENVKYLDRNKIREFAVSKWDMNVIKHQYQKHLDRLYQLWDRGWYQL